MPDGKCKQESCTVATSGLCLDGLIIDECPHYVPSTESDSQSESTVSTVVIQNDAPSVSPGSLYVGIPYGDDLDPESARRIMRRARTTVIVLAGEVNSGKTTILAAIYERFIDGPFAGFIFSGSETLPGFERRCHPSRITSEEERPDTDRTPRGQTRLIHLRLARSAEPHFTREVLFSDISGEDFEAARDSVELCREMPILKRADRCLLLVNAEKLANTAERRKTAAGAEMLLRSFLDSGMLGEDSIVDVLFTKYDKVVEHIHRDVAETYIDALSEEMTRKFASRLAALEFHRVAARPEKSDILPPAFGLDKILVGCTEPRGDRERIVKTQSDLVLDREFDRYLDRRLLNTSE